MTGPALTAAVCTRNRGRAVLRTIRSLLANDFEDFELLIVDQSTDDAFAQALEPLRTDARLRYIRTSTVGIGTARNMAVEAAKADIIAFTDDDCVVPADWLAVIHRLFVQHPEVGMVYCAVKPAPYDSAAGFVPTYERPGVHIVKTARAKARARGIGAGMGVRRSAALAVGNFDRSLGSTFPRIVGEEGDLALRLVLAGHYVLETDETAVVHDGFRTWEQGRELTRRNFLGIGMVYAKPLRCGDLRAMPVVLYEGLVIALLSPLAEVLRGRRPRGLRAFVYFWRGFLRGLRQPVDCRTLNFKESETDVA